ncbi:hypothetical protein GUITHDRAFT_100550 [Guillardia theta CCMP2712]|uniref:Uncharacterized protein n=1 Tax=Guillardia theta (strain CCMP2712) TaxID=905079 RepID=L1JZD1_GUITC|nr:hypothetical protein GUITHDRAFT_100550 [Guillardia theta CCMP2712]EKX53565.1 hypothetical protein GUITHDRAFT_100550 [Guillardia theta CCMP2712]|eukprot:XP_005840545.1 hypothetical protein GUITHDRAFT_100550 [Guillardia theta CCMP2712]
MCWASSLQAHSTSPTRDLEDPATPAETILDVDVCLQEDSGLQLSELESLPEVSGQNATMGLRTLLDLLANRTRLLVGRLGLLLLGVAASLLLTVVEVLRALMKELEQESCTNFPTGCVYDWLDVGLVLIAKFAAFVMYGAMWVLFLGKSRNLNVWLLNKFPKAHYTWTLYVNDVNQALHNHGSAGMLVLVASMAHVLAHAARWSYQSILSSAVRSSLWSCLMRDRVTYTGLIALVALLGAVAVMAFPPLLRTRAEQDPGGSSNSKISFTMTYDTRSRWHNVFWMMFVIVLMFHIPEILGVCMVAAPLSIYLLDVWIGSRSLCNNSHILAASCRQEPQDLRSMPAEAYWRWYWNERASQQEQRLAQESWSNVTVYHNVKQQPTFVSLRVPMASQGWKEVMGYMYIRLVDDRCDRRWHVFSAMEDPDNESCAMLWVDVSDDKRDWCWALQKQVLSLSYTASKLEFQIQGPYVSPVQTFRYALKRAAVKLQGLKVSEILTRESFLAFAQGIGITPCLRFLQEFDASFPEVDVVWLVRMAQLPLAQQALQVIHKAVGAAEHDLAAAQLRQVLRIHVFVTGTANSQTSHCVLAGLSTSEYVRVYAYNREENLITEVSEPPSSGEKHHFAPFQSPQKLHTATRPSLPDIGCQTLPQSTRALCTLGKFNFVQEALDLAARARDRRTRAYAMTFYCGGNRGVARDLSKHSRVRGRLISELFSW